MGHGAVPAVPAPAGLVLAFLDHLLHKEHVHVDSLWHHLAAVNNLHESLGYSRPYCSSPLDEDGRAALLRAANLSRVCAGLGMETPPAREGADVDDDDDDDDDEYGKTPGAISWALSASGGCADSLLMRREVCSPPPLTPIPPPMLPPDPPGVSGGSDFSV